VPVRPARAIERCGIARCERQRFGERRFRRIGTSFDEPHVPEPDERGDVVRFEREHAFEQRRPFAGFVPSPVNVRQKVRPAHVIWLERLSIEKGGLCRIEVLCGKQTDAPSRRTPPLARRPTDDAPAIFCWSPA